MGALEERYASQAMKRVFSKQRKFEGWRDCWIALAEAEMEMGLPVTQEQIDEMVANKADIDFDEAKRIEKETRHDVMAHITLYGKQCPKAKPIIHLGATSMMVCDNTELLQIRDALGIVNEETLGSMDVGIRRAMKYKNVPCLGYTHYQPAQPTTLGKRISLWVNGLAIAQKDIRGILRDFKGRGLKGTTGTQDSYMKLFDGDESKVEELDRRFCEKLGFTDTFDVTGQTYPREFDYQVLSALGLVATALGKAGVDIRLMCEKKDVEEPFGKKQVGSTAMAYKRNPIRTERMSALSRHLRALVPEAGETAAVQMLERSLDDSACRREYIPQAFYSADAILNLYMYVMDGLVVNPGMIERNLMKELPFMTTEEVLMASVRRGGDRQYVHGRIKMHSQEAGAGVKQGRDNDLLDRMADDPEIPLNRDEIYATAGDPSRFIGRAPSQVSAFSRKLRRGPLRGFPGYKSVMEGISV